MTGVVVAGSFFFSSRRRHTRLQGDWSSDVCSSDLNHVEQASSGQRAASSGNHASSRKLRRTVRPAVDEDRKSTRLNSSHLVISYAVFCLKKKKKLKQINIVMYNMIDVILAYIMN